MKSVKCVLAAVMAALVFGPVSVSAQQPGQDAYQVGQRLGQDTKTSAGAFKEISWDDLIPADWNPEKFFIDLKLDDLQDNDPRAMEVMQKIREEWDRTGDNTLAVTRGLQRSGRTITSAASRPLPCPTSWSASPITWTFVPVRRRPV